MRPRGRPALGRYPAAKLPGFLVTLFRRLALPLLLAVGGAVYIGINLSMPYRGFHQEAFVDLPKGTNARQMAEVLENAGVIRHSWMFLFARAVRRGAILQAGEYRFAQPASVLEVFDRIVRGDIFYYELVVPEGKNMFDIAAATERLRRNATPEQLCLTMTGKFREVWRGLHADAGVHRTVTLASLVEKEGKLPNERSVIASVFERRLSIGMKLDCDPTTIYAALLAGNYRGAIHKSDLASGDPYNTYQHAGLPPGPIANPGLASMTAVLHPADTDYLYFVARADGSGGHNFAATLAAQDANIAKYRHAIAHTR